MPADVYLQQAVFNKGELTPKLWARTDIEYFKSGARRMQNVNVLLHGGFEKRPGTRYVTDALDTPGEDLGRILPFIFSETQAYIIEFGLSSIGFITAAGVVETSPGVRYTIPSPYSEAELATLNYIQSADVMYIVQQNHPVYKLSRFAETNWTFEPVTFKNGPWLPINVEDNHATAVGLQRPTVATGSNGSNSADALVNQLDLHWTGPDDNAWWLLDFGVGNEAIVTGYALTTSANQTVGVAEYRMPRKWIFQGSDDAVSWFDLDRRRAEANWSASEIRSYSFINDRAFQYYRLYCEHANGTDVQMEIGIIQFYIVGRPGTLTFESTTGINGGAGFTADDIGRQIRWTGHDGFDRFFTITTIDSTTQVTGTWDGFWENLPSEPTKTWALGAFSVASGYPKAVTIFQERLCFAGTKAAPRTVYMSESAGYENFQIPDTLTDKSPITVTLAGQRRDALEWITEVEELLMCGTSDGVISVGGTENAIISPTNLRQRRHSNVGSANAVPPVRVGSTLLYLGLHQKSVHELVYGLSQASYDAPEISVLADHLFLQPATRLAYAHEPSDLVFIPSPRPTQDDSGRMIVLTYDRDQKVVGFSTFDFKQVTNQKAWVHDVAVIPEDGRDAIYFLARVRNDANTKLEVLRMDAPQDLNNSDTDTFFLDRYLVYEGPETTVLSGLDHLEDVDVKVVAWNTVTGNPTEGYSDNQEYTVVGGQITLPYAVTNAVVGKDYEAIVETMAHASPVPDGSSLGRQVRADGVIVHYVNSRSFHVDALPETSEDTLEPILDQRSLTASDTYVSRESGYKRVSIDDSWDGEGTLRFASSEPQPMTVTSVTTVADREPGQLGG